MRITSFIVAILVCTSYFVAAHAADADELLRQARAAWGKGDQAKAVKLVGQAIAKDKKNVSAYYLRGSMYEELRKHAEAVADYSQAIELNPKLAAAYNRRGSEQFKRGRVAESLADFDKYLALNPKDGPRHWKRGISCFYVGKFDAGRKQFERYEQVDSNDVENAVWHFICLAGAVGPDKARQSLLKIGKDKRVPMMEVYALFGGKSTPEKVLKVAAAGKPSPEQLKRQLFYAHLYLGIYYDILGKKKEALKHLELAADKYRIGHYMGDVAVVHRDILRKKIKR